MKVDIRGDIIPNNDKWIYDWLEMDSTCPRDVQNVVDKANGEPLEVYINSGGGDVFSGSEIYETLRMYKGKVKIHVTGIAASAASVILCAAESDIAPTAMVMGHNVASAARGDYHAMDKASEALKTANKAIAAAYVLKTGKTEDELLEMMDKETWMSAQEAVDFGLVDAISQESTQLINSAGLGSLPPAVIEKIRNTTKNPFKNESSCAKAQAALNLLKLKGKMI